MPKEHLHRRDELRRGAWLTEAEANYRMDVASGKYQRKPKSRPMTAEEIMQCMETFREGLEILGRRVQPFFDGLAEAEKRLAETPMVKEIRAVVGAAKTRRSRHPAPVHQVR